MTNSNFFLVNRGLLSSDRWLSEPFTRGQAWVDMFGLAQHSDGFFRVRGIKVSVLRGQLAYSQVTLSERWKWSRGKVKRYLDELEKDGDIVQQNNEVTTLITIVKYDFWQKKDKDIEQQTVQQTGSKQSSNGTHKKNDNNENNVNKPEPTIATSVAEGKKKEKPKDNDQPMSLSEFYEWTKKSPQRAVRVIGEWADTIKPQILTKGQWRVFLSRHLRAAQDVAKFTDKQIEDAYSKITELQKKSEFTPTLETLKKFLTN